MSAVNQAPCVGRPRSFDAEDVLEKALQVFWEKGYEGTSLTDLTQAMGINKPSLYSTFGNKEELFLKVVEVYEKRPCGYFHPSLAKETVKEVIASMLNGSAESLADKTHPQGCMIIQGALTGSSAADSVKEALIVRRRNNEEKLKARFELAQSQGELREEFSPELLASYLAVILQGMTIQATNGATATQLQNIADLAMANFPGIK